MKMKGIENTSHSFKIWLLLYVVAATVYRLIKTFYFPDIPIVSDQVILATILFSLVYVWIKEIDDRQALEQTHEELIRTHEQLKQANVNTMSSLILSVEAKDVYTSGHSRRVMEYSMALGKMMRLSEGQLNILRNGCLLHDIGKIGIPDSILLKREGLSDQDWQVIKRHPKNGVQILEPLDFLNEEKMLILHHHERFDGTGYPDGMKGFEIPQGARIMALADSYDAMKSKRIYRDPLADELIRQEVVKNAGTQFDPEIVSIFIEVIQKITERAQGG